jgi:hypothetical protein
MTRNAAARAATPCTMCECNICHRVYDSGGLVPPPNGGMRGPATTLAQ